MKQLKAAWLDIWGSVEILMVILIPVVLIIKGLIDLITNGQYELLTYLKLLATSLLGALIFFSLSELIEQAIHWWRNRA
ncbi:hypothetical protein [Lactiplantibacillus mudanjiangensis]|nr:hypothetical protein [Lactiplantibacillus mudanjiangensis]